MQVQQFFGIVNYVSEFIPNLAKMTSPLNQLLKKDSSAQWTHKEIKVVQSLKVIAQSLSTLQIPLHGKKIFQIDASNSFWSTVLLEEINEKRKIYGYKSGKFKDFEIHYHLTFKEYS